MTPIAVLWPGREEFQGREGFPASPRRAFRMLRRMVSRRRTYTQLSSLDDWTLKDLGLHRSEIAAVALDPTRGRSS